MGTQGCKRGLKWKDHNTCRTYSEGFWTEGLAHLQGQVSLGDLTVHLLLHSGCRDCHNQLLLEGWEADKRSPERVCRDCQIFVGVCKDCQTRRRVCRDYQTARESDQC